MTMIRKEIKHRIAPFLNLLQLYPFEILSSILEYSLILDHMEKITKQYLLF